MISIIVPVYNVEKYLDDCLVSIVNQTFANLEIILIDDGSTDKSGLLCDNRSLKDSRIRVIHQKNGGLSNARNTGLDNAQGEYISFVDSDDIILPHFISTLYNNILSTHADLSVCRFFTFIDHYKNNTSEVKTKKVYSREKYLLSEYSESSCIKLYKRELFSDLRFKTGVIREDAWLNHYLVDKCNIIVTTRQKLYGYRERAGSITQTISKKKLQQLYDCFVDRERFYKTRGNKRQAKIAQLRQEIIRNDFYRYFGQGNFWDANKRLYRIILSSYTTLFRKAYVLKQLYLPFLTLQKQKLKIVND